MFNHHAVALGSSIPAADLWDLYPTDSVETCNQIDSLNAQIYTGINNAAYKAGFSSDQAVYAAAYMAYFETLASLEFMLASDGRPFFNR